MLYVSNDGYVRLTLEQLQDIHFTHLISGLDGDSPVVNICTLDKKTGYTEFVSAQPAALTLGWDWRLERMFERVSLIRLDEPRSNIMLQTRDKIDLGSHTTALLLASFVDTLAWETAALEDIRTRYRD